MERLLEDEAEFDKSLKSKPIWKLWTGDFNADSHEPCFETIATKSNFKRLPMPEWTTMKERADGLAVRQIDNILTCGDRDARLTLVPISILDCPSRADPTLKQYLPIDANPSDHIPVVADFLIVGGAVGGGEGKVLI